MTAADVFGSQQRLHFTLVSHAVEDPVFELVQGGADGRVPAPRLSLQLDGITPAET